MSGDRLLKQREIRVLQSEYRELLQLRSIGSIGEKSADNVFREGDLQARINEAVPNLIETIRVLTGALSGCMGECFTEGCQTCETARAILKQMRPTAWCGEKLEASK